MSLEFLSQTYKAEAQNISKLKFLKAKEETKLARVYCSMAHNLFLSFIFVPSCLQHEKRDPWQI